MPSVQATQADNKDRSALTTVSMIREGTAPTKLKFSQETYGAEVLESAPVNSVVARLAVNRPEKVRMKELLPTSKNSIKLSQLAK
jgi:hypothetical protein